jgi:hypothetical protein
MMADSALGKGLDALIKSSKSKSKKEKTEKKVKESKNLINNGISLNDDKVEQIKEEVSKNPRISLWSAKSAACLRYLKKTTPEFSISNEASIILEEAIKDKYPDIWELFEDI